MYWEQPAGTSAFLKSIILINVINTDGAQPGLRPISALQNVTLDMCIRVSCNYLFENKFIFTIRRSIIQDPFDKHQDSHVEK